MCQQRTNNVVLTSCVGCTNLFSWKKIYFISFARIYIFFSRLIEQYQIDYDIFCFFFNPAPPPPATNIRFTDRLEGFIVHWDFVRKDLISYDFRLTTSDKKVLDYSMAESTRENVYFLKYEIRGIERGTEYSFQMRSVDRDNQIGEWSSPIKYTTVSEIKPYVDATMPLKTALGEGIEKTITCNIRGEPMPKIEWTKNGVAISESDPEYEMVNDKGELIFLNPVREATNGEYQCKGTNEFGSILNNPTKVNVECEYSMFSP